jgi:hypothetical protein
MGHVVQNLGVGFDTFTPSVTGFSVNPGTITGAYTQIGKLVFVRLFTSAGTSNATTFTITLPVNSFADAQRIPIPIENNGTRAI